MSADLAAAIDRAWDARADVTPASHDVREPVEAALELLDAGSARVAEPDGNGGWRVNQWLKKAVLLSFRLNDNAVIDGGRTIAEGTSDQLKAQIGGHRVVVALVDAADAGTATQILARHGEGVPVVGADGRATNIKVVSGLGHGLNEAAVAALKACRFTPGERSGVPVPVRIREFKIRFFLDQG